ncbi:hypothetical protein NUW54_g3716 [Trametes sanguinea]|uniref:Uncharacterized protein n=1 Tax=Trametes sanguinea TaxID=158606 RepID=A0ACC1Q001_9APHY|nr:hypothetical protein NUW54_g3716 [Trametes sanguinea]
MMNLARAIAIPLFPFEKYIIAHAIFCVIGFLGFLPLGALLARYTRTYTPSWFTAHWICQLALGASARPHDMRNSPLRQVGLTEASVARYPQLARPSSLASRWESMP